MILKLITIPATSEKYLNKVFYKCIFKKVKCVKEIAKISCYPSIADMDNKENLKTSTTVFEINTSSLQFIKKRLLKIANKFQHIAII